MPASVYRACRRDSADSAARKYLILCQQQALGFADMLQLWQDDAGFRTFFNALLANLPWPAFYWEMPPLTRSATSHPAEFVVLESDLLDGVQADPVSFREHFGAGTQVVCFDNLGGDARLVVPVPRAAPGCYPHLAAFVRQAPPPQQHAFWQCLGSEIEVRLSDRPLWVSTAGQGVFWLHARLDSTPKYYQYAPYRKSDRSR